MKSAPPFLLLIKSCPSQDYKLEEISQAYCKMNREQWKRGQVSSDIPKQQNRYMEKEKMKK